MEIDRLSLLVVTLAYPLVAVSFLVLSVGLFARFYYIKPRMWILACSIVCLIQSIGMGLASLAISAIPLYPRATVIPWSRLVLSMSALPLMLAAYSVSREVLTHLLTKAKRERMGVYQSGEGVTDGQ